MAPVQAVDGESPELVPLVHRGQEVLPVDPLDQGVPRVAREP